MKIRLCLFFFALCCPIYAQPAPAFAFHQTAAISPDQFADIETGTFGLPFIGVPQRRFMPHPYIPKEMEGRSAVIRAALRVGKDGRVRTVRILECSVELSLIEKEATRFFERIVYRPETQNKKKIEFETDVILGLKRNS